MGLMGLQLDFGVLLTGVLLLVAMINCAFLASFE